MSTLHDTASVVNTTTRHPAAISNAPPAPQHVTRGFAVPCIKCGDTGSVRVSLDDVSAFLCGSCDADFTADEVQEAVAAWSKVLAWIATAPPVE